MKKKCRVEVIDSQAAVMTQGLLVILAAKAARSGAGLEEVRDIVQQNIPRAHLRAAFDTLEYLQRGGRIGKAQALLGSMLKINPIIGLKDGVVFPFGKERSRIKAVEHLHTFALSFSSVDEMAVEYAVDRKEADNLAERLSQRYPKVHIFRSRASPVIGTHTGPGLLAVSVLGTRQSAKAKILPDYSSAVTCFLLNLFSFAVSGPANRYRLEQVIKVISRYRDVGYH
jgi:DegV family protein with EDD domain